jgi:hypothetical protein
MRVGGLLAVVALVGAVLVGAPAEDAAAASTAPTPVVEGSQLVDSRTGETWVARAVNWPSFEYACQQGWAYASSGRTAEAATAMASWGITAVRLPLNESCWLGVDGAPAYGTVSGYRAAIRDWVDILTAAGLVVILDLHWTAPAGYPANGQRAMPDARAVTFWQQVAGTYADSRSVLFDLFNEPYSRWDQAAGSWAFQLTWTCWRDGGCRAPVENDQTGALGGGTYPVAGMAQLVAAVRGAGATQPILLGGLDYANDLRQWLAFRPADTQLVASWHNYPGQRCSSAVCWNAEISPVAAAVPVIATEFGQTDGGSAFLTAFLDWADAHGVGYAPWAWWIVPASEDLAAHRYALIADAAFTPQAPAGTTYHDHLLALPGGDPPGRSALESFVVADYTDVLGRTPSDSEIAYWTRLLGAGMPRSRVAELFITSEEYRALSVTRAYADVFGRAPDANGFDHWMARLRAGVVQPDDVHRTFLYYPEFYLVQGGGTDRGYVEALYRDILGREADEEGAVHWTNRLHQGRPWLVDQLWFAPETFRHRVSDAFVTFLGRAPSPSEIESWSAYAYRHGLTGLRSGLMSSEEYLARAATRYP